MLTKNVMPKFEMSKFNDETRDKEAYYWTKFTTKGFIKEKKNKAMTQNMGTTLQLINLF